jgi:hypothetical protein
MQYKGTSLKRSSNPLLGHNWALDIVLLQGLRGALFRMSEIRDGASWRRRATVCFYARVRRPAIVELHQAY